MFFKINTYLQVKSSYTSTRHVENSNFKSTFKYKFFSFFCINKDVLKNALNIFDK